MDGWIELLTLKIQTSNLPKGIQRGELFPNVHDL